jgi:hypothetical protein
MNDTTLARLQLLESQGCDVACIWADLSDAKPGRVDPSTLKAKRDAIDKADVIKTSSCDARRHRSVHTRNRPAYGRVASQSLASMAAALRPRVLGSGVDADQGLSIMLPSGSAVARCPTLGTEWERRCAVR